MTDISGLVDADRVKLSVFVAESFMPYCCATTNENNRPP